MDTWQAWAAALFGFILSILSFNYQQEKKRNDVARKEFEDHRYEAMERIVRIEAEIMTEREVREILQEFLNPFLASLHKIDNKTDNIAKDITDLKVQLAAHTRTPSARRNREDSTV